MVDQVESRRGGVGVAAGFGVPTTVVVGAQDPLPSVKGWQGVAAVASGAAGMGTSRGDIRRRM
uniref:Uncharacterized protein n=1 Tax=Oryza barthii TaxID=65489 RepID=A0A0D3EN50_9ORYZ